MIGDVLVIETATDAGSVAIARDGQLLADVSFASRDPVTGARTEALAPAVAHVLQLAGINASQLAAIVCGSGPGGFTSLRSAAALAKGICSVTHAPLYAVSSLAVLAWSESPPAGHYVAAIAAGRNEWFAADVKVDERSISLGGSYIIGDEDLRRRARVDGLRLIGVSLELNTPPSAAAVVVHLAEVEAAGPVDLDSWEPAYGRLAEAQVKWEAAHGRPLSV